MAENTKSSAHSAVSPAVVDTGKRIDPSLLKGRQSSESASFVPPKEEVAPVALPSLVTPSVVKKRTASYDAASDPRTIRGQRIYLSEFLDRDATPDEETGSMFLRGLATDEDKHQLEDDEGNVLFDPQTNKPVEGSHAGYPILELGRGVGQRAVKRVNIIPRSTQVEVIFHDDIMDIQVGRDNVPMNLNPDKAQVIYFLRPSYADDKGRKHAGFRPDSPPAIWCEQLPKGGSVLTKETYERFLALREKRKQDDEARRASQANKAAAQASNEE